MVINSDMAILDARIAGAAKSGPEICSWIESRPETENTPAMLISAESDLPKIAKDCGGGLHASKPLILTM